MNNREIHRETIKALGITDNVLKIIQEQSELTELLRSFLTINMLDGEMVNHDELKKLFDNIKEERCDVANCLDKIDEIFHFQDCEIEDLKRAKMVRTLDRLGGKK